MSVFTMSNLQNFAFLFYLFVKAQKNMDSSFCEEAAAKERIKSLSLNRQRERHMYITLLGEIVTKD